MDTSSGLPPHPFLEAQQPARTGRRRDPSYRGQVCERCIPAGTTDLMPHGATRCLSTRSKQFSRSSPLQHWCGSFGGKENPTSRYGAEGARMRPTGLSMTWLQTQPAFR